MGSSSSTVSKHPLGLGLRADARIEGGDTRRRGRLPAGRPSHETTSRFEYQHAMASYRQSCETTRRETAGILRDFAASEAATGGALPPPGPPLASSLFPSRKDREKNREHPLTNRGLS